MRQRRRQVAVDFQATDYADRPVSLPPVSVSVPPQESIKQDVPLPAEWKGYYRDSCHGKRRREVRDRGSPDRHRPAADRERFRVRH